MTEAMKTRESLLIRLSRGQCNQAWDEFADIYRPMILRLARQSGLQECDADDVTQKVMISIARTIGTWQKDDNKSGFRAWLTTVTRNAIKNAFTRVPRDRLMNSTQLFCLIEDASDRSTELDRHIETEFMRAVFRTAADRVRQEFAETTWQAFWQTTVGQLSIKDAAEQQSTTCGAIYAARSRVMRRLQQTTHQILAEGDDS